MHNFVPVRSRLAVAAAVVLALAVPPTAQAQQAQDPPFSVAQEDLEASLWCSEFTNLDKEPLLLVHGTGTYGEEQYSWNWALELPKRGFDFCWVTYPDRGMGDQQISAEYVAWAVQQVHERSGRMVDLVGHSQGASMPRWALRWWPSVLAAVDDYIGIAGPYHGTSVAGGGSGGNMPAAFWQFSPGSDFNRVLNEGDETYGDVDWTNLYTMTDELVQPAQPVPTAALDFGEDNSSVANILMQDLCPLRPVDHLTIGTTDRLAFDLALDAAANDGPADPSRLGLGPDCNVAQQMGGQPANGLGLLLAFLSGPPDFHNTSSEPELMPYAQGSPGATPQPGPEPEPSPAPATAAAPQPEAALPVTGSPFGLALLGLALPLLARRSRRS